MMYTWTFNPNNPWPNDTFDTIEECLGEARCNPYYEGQIIYIGEAIPYTFTVDAEYMLDRLSEQAFYEVGEVADDWPYGYRSEDLDKLAEKLTECVTEWLKEHNDLPSFYKVSNVRAIGIDNNENSRLWFAFRMAVRS